MQISPFLCICNLEGLHFFFWQLSLQPYPSINFKFSLPWTVADNSLYNIFSPLCLQIIGSNFSCILVQCFFLSKIIASLLSFLKILVKYLVTIYSALWKHFSPGSSITCFSYFSFPFLFLCIDTLSAIGFERREPFPPFNSWYHMWGGLGCIRLQEFWRGPIGFRNSDEDPGFCFFPAGDRICVTLRSYVTTQKMKPPSFLPTVTKCDC